MVRQPPSSVCMLTGWDCGHAAPVESEQHQLLQNFHHLEGKAGSLKVQLDVHFWVREWIYQHRPLKPREYPVRANSRHAVDFPQISLIKGITKETQANPNDSNEVKQK